MKRTTMTTTTTTAMTPKKSLTNTMKKTWVAQAGALLLGAALLTGCSSGSSTTGTTSGPTNAVTGKTTQTTATTATPITVPATGGTTQTVSVGSQQVSAVVPSGAANVGQGATLAVVQSGSAPLSGNFTNGASITVNGVANSGLTINGDGAIVQNVALPIDSVNGTDYTLDIPQGNLLTRALTVQTIQFSGRYYIRNGVLVSPFPTNITGVIPSNGENAVGSKVTATFGAGNDGRAAHLTINYGNGFVLDQTQLIASNQVVFQNLTTDASNVPSSGVKSLTFAVGN